MQTKIQKLIEIMQAKEKQSRRFSEQSNLHLIVQELQQARAETWEQAIAMIKIYLVHDLFGHQGDPCIYCGTPHGMVEPGACPGR